MNGSNIKIIPLHLILLATTFLPTISSATTSPLKPDETPIFSSKLGCMACHQSDTSQSDTKSNDNEETPPQKN